MREYNKKITYYRISFFVMVAAVIGLISLGLIDYAVFLSFITLFLGIFSTSTTEVHADNLIIRKNYFWSIFGFKTEIPRHQILTIQPKNYNINLHEDAHLMADNLFEFFALDSFKPKVKWKVSKITYKIDGRERCIEASLAREDIVNIDRRMKTLPNN